MKEKFNITGMTCSACSSRVEKSVAKLEGVQNATVNLLTNSMQVDYDSDALTQGDIIGAVVHSGYGAVPDSANGSRAKKADSGTNKSKLVEEQMADFKKRLWVSFSFLIPLMYISMGHMWGLPLPSFLMGHQSAIAFAFSQFLLCLPIVYINMGYFTKGFYTLFHGSPNMDSLIAVGSSSALIYGIFAIYRIGYGLGVGDMELVSRYHMDLYFESA
ncbi:MAG: cation transporter, partial [Oscillospiraceae bacterium]